MYRARLKKDLARWVSQGLITADTAEAMLADQRDQPAVITTGGVLMMLSAVLISAALLLLVAANWQAIPRLVKVGGILTLIWIFHLGGALLMARGRVILGEVLLVLGAVSFGAAISLVAQLYHLSGDVLDALALWLCGALAACLAFRSQALGGVVVLLAAALVVAGYDQNQWNWAGEARWLSPAMVVLILFPAWWVRRPALIRGALLLLYTWLIWIYSLSSDNQLAAAYVVAGVTIFVLSALVAQRGLLREAGVYLAPFALLLAAFGLLVLNMEYDEGLPLAGIAVLTLAVAILALALKGSEDATIRALAYGMFAAEVLYLSFTTIDSLLGTSGFFFLSGLIVAALAFAVLRLERHFKARRVREAQ
ncbi:DUF2157 domain-containing protein [Rhizobium paknamense]|uniref:Membrane protein n=1 Tax=Rhizobium paknamense TaxID=1206817 RepID=A0ABU0IIH0_9HYPH|nr:DUF2157 domain-containing protein [Rhizobium paknamense]MDQ0457220.1 putative membrane protein [Rhizobium paknamense]